QGRGGGVVGGEERFDREFSRRDVDGRTEGRHGTKEGELLRGGCAQDERHEQRAAVGMRRGFAVARIALQFGLQRGERLVCREQHLAMQPRQQVGAVLGEVTICGASPSGCRVTRRALTGGAISSGATPLLRIACVGRLAETMFQCRSTTRAGNGSWPASSFSIAARTGAISAVSSAVSR